jgi:hypothetical protein
MATGVVSLAAREMHLVAVSIALLALAGVTYLLLLAAHTVRVVRRPAVVLSELVSARAFEYLTIVAAGSVLGSDLLLVGAGAAIGWSLLVLSASVWLAVSVSLTLDFAHHSLHARELKGVWLLAVVAPQSLSLLVVALLDRSGWRMLATLALALWLLGSALYPPMALVRLRRLGVGLCASRRVRPDDWVLMGALAISAVAASQLLDLPRRYVMPPPMHLIVLVGAVLQVVLAGIFTGVLAWEELDHLRRFHVEPPASRRWVTVFPIGMFALACHSLAGDVHLRPLSVAGDICSGVALGIWLIIGVLIAAHRVGSVSHHHGH